ncbi:hypothetical protein NCC49_002895 [Naganishia albida]|nr:hypothetical protein NCC49_002895 [Naganishia albida]
MSWSRSTISATCRRVSSPLTIQHHTFSTSSALSKKFKPQDLYLLPGQPPFRKSKVPKKVLAWRAQREGLVESTSAEADPVAIFAEELEIEGRQRRRGRRVEEAEQPFGLKPKASLGFGIPKKPEEVEEEEPLPGGLPFGIDPKAAARQGRPETRMHRRIRHTRESLVDLDKPRTASSPALEVHPDTVVPSWKIPLPSEYEKYARRRTGVGARERRPGEGRRRAGWSDDVVPRTDRRRGETPSRHEQETGNLTANLHTSSTRTDIPRPPAERTPGRWEPTKKISIPAMQGLRALHQSDPKTFSHAVLSEKFGVSREAVARIIRSRFRDGQ